MGRLLLRRLVKMGFAMDEEATRHLAEQLRAEMSTLLAPGDASAVDGELADLLERGRAGENVAVPILRLLRSHPALRRAASEFLHADPARGVALPPGERRLPLGPRYVCPVDGYEFFRRDVAKPVPPCPNDGSELVLDAGEPT
jgi:hypothetical protein